MDILEKYNKLNNSYTYTSKLYTYTWNDVATTKRKNLNNIIVRIWYWILKGLLDWDSFASRLGMQMQLAGCIFSTTFYTETLGISRLHSSSRKRIAWVDRARVSVITSELNHITLLFVTHCNTLIPDTARQTRDACAALHETQHWWVGKRVSLSSRRRTICICIPFEMQKSIRPEAS